MNLWTFYEWVTGSGRGTITEWYESELAPEAQQDFDDLLRYLAITPRHLWERPKFSLLTGYPGIGELRFKANKKQYRPFGFFGPKAGQFTLLIGAQERGGKFVPKDAPKTALERKLVAETQPGRIREYEY